MNDRNRLVKKIAFATKMELITGMRIGGGKESVEIGGVDLSVIRRKDNYQPYVPGSSLKGKIRCLLELAHGSNLDNGFKFDKSNKDISLLFGSINGDSSVQSRIIVRDAYLTEESAKKLESSPHTDLPFTEVKTENWINRLKGTAEAPRQIERVPAGSVFSINMVINIFEGDGPDAESRYKSLLENGLNLLQNDYLGSSGTRGYGQVKFAQTNQFEEVMPEFFANLSSHE